MPYYKRKEKCTNKSGKKGTFVTIKKDGGKRQCWKSEQAFKRSTAARHANEADENQELIELANEKHDIMRITKRQLKRIIKEEKAKLLEYGGGDPNTPAGRAMGLYFDVSMMQQVGSALDALFHNAMEAAEEDGMIPEEAYDAVTAGIRQLVEDEIEDTMRY